MTDQECDQVFRQLVKFLRNEGLDWLVDAVTATIEEGKEKETTVQAFDEIPGTQGGRSWLSPSRTVKATSIVELTSSERLECIISAIESVVVETAFMEEATVGELSASSPATNQPTVVRFLSPSTGQTVHEYSERQAADRVISARRLQKLLSELRNEI